MRPIAPALVLLLLSACNGGEDECFDDRTCGTGNRCEIPAVGMPGTCTPCGANEIPYDGVDNDCNLSTRDRDLDGDGDNSFEGGGSDCDDNDPAVSSKKAEVCQDLKDNDCDGNVDELDCSDRESPTVVFISPLDNARLSGTFDVRAMVFDDVGLVSARLFVGNTPVAAARDFTPPVANQTVTFTVDSLGEGLPDGPSTLRIELEDVAGKAGQATRTVILDNSTPPEITPISPLARRAYGGTMVIAANATDTSSVVVSFSFNGTQVATATRAPYRTVVDTRLVPDGTATVSISASDLDGNTRTQDIHIIVDNTPPQVRFVTPAPGEVVSLMLEVHAEAADATGIVRIYSSGLSRTSTSISYTVDTELLLDGPYTFTASAADAALVDGVTNGNVGYAMVTVTIENANNPVVTLSPPNGDAVFGQTSIEATVTSPLGLAISTVEIFVDGLQLVVTGNNNPRRASYDFLLHPSPTSVIEAIAYDEDGRPGRAVSTVTITRPPVFRVAPQRGLVNGFSNDGYDVGDVTGDGVPDVVAGGNRVQVLTGTVGANGDWTPGPAVILDPVNGADLVELIDTDGDQDRDLFTLTGNRIRVYLNDGGLPAEPDFTVQLAQFNTYGFMETADLDGDSDADVILAGAAGVDLVVARNQANASLSFDGSYGLVANVSDLQVADADDDGDLDAVIARSGNTNVITTYRNLGDGTFGAGQDSFAGAARYVAIGDVTGDGYPDVVAVVQTGSLEVLSGDPATPGTFTQSGSQTIPPMSREVRLTDIDLDGDLDAVVNAYQANAVDELINLGAGVFADPNARPRFIIARRPVRPRLWDLDGDGDLDYLAIGSTDSTLAFSENLGLGTFFAAPVLTPSEVPRAIAAGDVYAGDAQDDIVLGFSEVMTTPARVSVWQNSAGDFTPRGDVSVGFGVNRPTSISIGDLDGAGLLDIAVGSNESTPDTTTGDAQAVALLNDGNLAFTIQHLVITRPLDAVVADADNDGIDEVIFTYDLGALPVEGSEVWDVSGGAPVQLRQWPEGLGARAVAAGDLAGDPAGFIDYAVANAVSNDITVSLWNGLGWSSTTYTALPGIADVAIGYVGNDAYGDLIAVGTPGLVVMDGVAGNAFAQPVTYPAGPMPSKLVSGDFNDDGLNDVLVLNGANLVSALIGRPQGGFFAPLSIPVGDGPVDFVTTDFDGDGRGDLAIACGGVPAVVMVYSDAP